MPALELQLSQIATLEADGTIGFNASGISTIAASPSSFMIFYLTQQDEQNGYGTVIQLDENHQAAIFPDLNPEYTYLFFQDDQKVLQTLLWCIEFATRTNDGLYITQAKVHGRGVTAEDMLRFNQIMLQPQNQPAEHDLNEEYSTAPAAATQPAPGADATSQSTSAPVVTPLEDSTPAATAAPASATINTPAPATPSSAADAPATQPSASEVSPAPAEEAPAAPSTQPSSAVGNDDLLAPLEPAPAAPTAPSADQASTGADFTNPQPTFVLGNSPAEQTSSSDASASASPSTSLFAENNTSQASVDPIQPQPVDTSATAEPEPIKFPSLPPLPTPAAQEQSSDSSDADSAPAPSPTVDLPPLPELPTLPNIESTHSTEDAAAPADASSEEPQSADTNDNSPSRGKNPVGRPQKPLLSDAAWRVEQSDFSWAKSISRDSIEPNRDKLHEKVFKQIERNQPELLQDSEFMQAFEAAYASVLQTYELAPTARQDILKSLLNGRIIENLAKQRAQS